MGDISRRLRHPVPGEHLIGVTSLVDRLDARGRYEDRRVMVPDRSAFRPDTGIREVKRKADPFPNAPLLIRVVKFPYGLQPGVAVRVPLFEQPESRQRVPFIVIWQGAQAAAERVPFRSPAGARQPASVRIRERDMVDQLVRNGIVNAGEDFLNE